VLRVLKYLALPFVVFSIMAVLVASKFHGSSLSSDAAERGAMTSSPRW
jgi:hypothetical protein